MYWLPILENNGKSLVYFELTDEREAGNKLIIDDKEYTIDTLLKIADERMYEAKRKYYQEKANNLNR